LLNHRASASDQFVDIYDVFIDGNKINADKTNILKYRQILSQDGVINVTLSINRSSKTVNDLPILSIRGSFYAKTSTQLIITIASSIKQNLESLMQKKQNGPITDAEIKKVSESTTDLFI
jgi:ribonuclease J